MKKYRRIEITAFRRRVTIISSKPKTNMQTDEEIFINTTDSAETINTESDEGQQILLEAIHLLEEKLK